MGTRFKTESKDPAVNVTTWVLLVVVILSVSARLGTKFNLFRKLTVDDWLMVGSLVFCVVQSIIISMAVASGYGKHFKDVSSPEFDQTMKYLYAGSLLYLISLALSKLSLAVFIRSLTPASKDRVYARIVEGIICTWAVATIFGTAFQCSMPRTWDFWNGKCFDEMAWIFFVTISNIVTDLIIFAQAMILISSIQTSLKRRLIFAGIFVPRLLWVLPEFLSVSTSKANSQKLYRVPAAAIAQLALINKGRQSNDPTYGLCDLTILEEIIQCLSIVTACWGQLKPFLSWMRTNGLKIEGVDDPTSWNYKYSHRSQTNLRSIQRGHETFPNSLRDQILVTQDWEVDSQSSRAQIISENQPWPVDETGKRSGDRSSG
ncbi:hypothetical protein VI817_000511 [Penicillium citrinum]|uniref:Rhodopsin domain-containing protein n=1 Tax=Penicillium hetheringtonii TaxID=911720 RepID=A0AAD6E2M2_9EURO|nr:hypothetical protein N7450_000414 [Penicillium hetheringtonii]KAK5806253.1 hypothetical protein VI817_000511 [Penicillium citrinum]